MSWILCILDDPGWEDAEYSLLAVPVLPSISTNELGDTSSFGLMAIVLMLVGKELLAAFRSIGGGGLCLYDGGAGFRCRIGLLLIGVVAP